MSVSKNPTTEASEAAAPAGPAESFCHLHVHSEYSSLDGACKIKQLVALAKERGHTALGLSDHGTISGLPAFEKACKAAGIKAIHSCEIYLTDDQSIKKRDTNTWHLGLIARTSEGLRNLYAITSRAYLGGYFNKRPRADWEILRQHSEGIIALTGCMAAPVMGAIFQGDLTAARGYTERLIEIFGRENVYGEIQNVGIVEQIPADSELAHKLGKFTLSQTEANRELAIICRDLGIPLIATGDVHYLGEGDAFSHDALLCVGTGQKQPRNAKGEPDLENRRFSLLPKRYHFRTEAEMVENLPEWPEAMANTLALADRCDAEIAYDQPMLPRFPLAEGFETSNAYLDHLCEIGMEKRYGPREQQTTEQRERLEFELGVIDRMGFNDYFLIVWDFVREAISRGIPSGPGRGSAAGSIVSYVLEITHLDPLEYDLLFERFLNPDRISMPDVDWDVSIVRREEMIEYVREKYNTLAGCDTAVSQIITHGMIQAKAGLRDAARVLDKPISLADKLCKMVPDKPIGMGLREVYKVVPDFRRAFENDPDAQEVIKLAGWMEGFIRNEGVHAAGVVIWDQPLERALPIQQKGEGTPITTSWDMKSTEAVGALKMDFLGLRNLDIFQRAIEIVKHTEGIELDAYKLPLDDRGTYEMLARGEAIGVFQLESGGMREALRLIKPTEFADIIALVALYRPGPMDYIPTYAARKHGQEETTFLDPRLEPIIGPTYGIAVYQEQLMLTARAIANFTPGEADTLRKAIGKKNAELMATLKPKFIEGCAANGVAKAKAEQLWSDNEKAAEYSFNKSHAACYALISYITAYLKHNHPAAYMAALISLNASTKDKVPFFITEARRMGLKVLPPDLNRSLRDFAVMEAEGADETTERTKRFEILFGLQAIKGVGTGVIGEIRAEREKNGPFRSLLDLIRRLPELNKTVLERLVVGGALDFTGHSRKAMVEAIETTLEANKKRARELEKAFIENVREKVLAARIANPSEATASDAAPAAEGDTLFDLAASTPKTKAAAAKAPKLSTDDKKGLESISKQALKDEAAPSGDRATEIALDALTKEALRKARLAAKKDEAEDPDAAAQIAVAETAPARAALARQLAAEAEPACAAALSEREDDSEEAALEEHLALAGLQGPDWDQLERLTRERKVLGLFASAHPLDGSKREWRRYITHTIGSLNGLSIGRTVTVVGAITSLRVLKKKTGERFGIEVELEDLTGSRPVTFFDDSLKDMDQSLLEEGQLCVVKARVQEDAFKNARKEAEAEEGAEEGEQTDKAVKMNGIAVYPWKPAQVDMTPISPLEIDLPARCRDKATIARLIALLEAYPGASPVYLTLGGERHMLREKVKIGPALTKEIEALLRAGVEPEAAA